MILTDKGIRKLFGSFMCEFCLNELKDGYSYPVFITDKMYYICENCYDICHSGNNKQNKEDATLRKQYNIPPPLRGFID